MTTTTGTCWADPLSRDERRVLREKLARACKKFWDASGRPRRGPRAATEYRDLVISSAEMSDLHLDVTERAEPAAS